MAAGVALTLAACGGGSDGGGWLAETEGRPAAEPAGEMSKARAFCNDLEAGYTTFQILRDYVKDGTYTPEGAAEAASAMVREECPEQLDTNAELRDYLQGWGIDPDQR